METTKTTFTKEDFQNSRKRPSDGTPYCQCCIIATVAKRLFPKSKVMMVGNNTIRYGTGIVSLPRATQDVIVEYDTTPKVKMAQKYIGQEVEIPNPIPED